MEKINFINSEIKNYKSCSFLKRENVEKVINFLKTHKKYKPTPLVNLENLAKKFGLKKIYVKDESKRLELNSFKAVGVLYAVARIICEKFNLNLDELKFEDLLEPTLNKKIRKMGFIAASDGNHGRGLAWVSNQLGCFCHIYMPKNTTIARVKSIENFGAKVIVTERNYDETLRLVIETARKNNWEHVQDQAWEGYTKVAGLISEGYMVIAEESLEQMNKDNVKKPTHILLQAGAGTFALGIMGYYSNVFKEDKPYMAILEPQNAACYYNSIKSGKYNPVGGELKTVMAGLSVGEPNIVAWDILKTIVNGYASCADNVTARGMRILANPLGNDKKVISGESGALGLGFLSMVCQNNNFEEIKTKLRLKEDSVVLAVNTEGDTDPEVYERIVWNGEFSI